MKQIAKRRAKVARRLVRYRQVVFQFATYVLLFSLCLILLPFIMYQIFGLGLYLFIALLMFSALVYLSFTKKNVHDKLSWFLVILVLPFFGVFLFWFIGVAQLDPKTYRLKSKVNTTLFQQYNARLTVPLDDRYARLQQLAPQSCFTYQNNITFLEGAQVYEQIYQDMKQAQQSIHIEMYISRMDEVTKPLFELLKQKVQAGIQVRFLADVVGHLRFKDKDIQDLVQAGVQFSFFNQHAPKYFDHFRANHRKYIIIDGAIAYTGGVNLGREYIHGYPKKKMKWYDMMGRMEGDVVRGIQFSFLADWCFSTRTSMQEMAVEVEQQIALRPLQQPPSTITALTQSIADGPDYEATSIKRVLQYLLQTAKQRVWITTPYLIPPEDVAHDLMLAASSGIDVRIIIPGVPDKRFVYACSESYIEKMLCSGIKIYKAEQTFVHSKMIVIDQEVSLFGTVNIDMRSFYLNLEHLVIQHGDQLRNAELAALVDQLRAKSVEITLDEWCKRGIFQKTSELASRVFAPLF